MRYVSKHLEVDLNLLCRVERTAVYDMMYGVRNYKNPAEFRLGYERTIRKLLVGYSNQRDSLLYRVFEDLSEKTALPVNERKIMDLLRA